MVTRILLTSLSLCCCQVLGLSLEFAGAPLRFEAKKKYLGRKMAERKRKKEAGELPQNAVSEGPSLSGIE